VPGRTRFRRLYLIGACSPALRIEALRAAVTEARSGSDLKSYEDALQLLRRSSRSSETEFQADLAWMEKKDKQNKAETTRLEHELKGYKNNLIKESIRVSFPCHYSLPWPSHLLTLFTYLDGQ
jgi:COP9 signalosome complex subunit 1